VPEGASPGDLVTAVRVDGGDGDGGTSEGYPTGAQVFRILYVSTAADENDLHLVCGTVTLPEDGPALTPDGRTRVLAWAHGTQGLEQQCLPSSDPSKGIWGVMPAGIQTVGWGSLLGRHRGDPADGQLQYAVDQGWVVATADYQPADTYVLGRVAGANVLDSVRAARQLAGQQFDRVARAGSDVVVAGHSQGGHAALWAGQLADPYLAATGTASTEVRLVGVEALAPAANFVVQPERQPGTSFGDGLADREMHQSIGLLPLPVPALEIQVGPALFSYIFGSWSQFSAGRAPAAGALTPAAPSTGPLELARVATPEGQSTIAQVQPLCLGGSDSTRIQRLVSPYRDASAHQMLVPALWNLPEDYRTGEYFTGGVDRTCAEADATLDGWCEWIRWNMPGPLGENPFPKVPTSGGRPVPLLIAQGTADTVIHCVAPAGLPADDLPAVSDCTSRALYESMVEEYCPADGDRAALQLRLFRKGPNSPAEHLSIPGQMAARELGRSAADLSYEGSPTQQFIESAFAGTVPTGCDALVLNP
jgi:acetyl esterase/lipase